MQLRHASFVLGGISVASDGDTILIARGTYEHKILTMNKRLTLAYPYLLKNAHLGQFSSAQNPHCFGLDQLYNIAKDLEEHNNILYDVVGTPNPSDN
jgi:hypothetical protein